ncbi:sugar ABC transporter ATP-binding protein [Oceaniradius stylonematis]|uniref:Sugar ABC transporter ATP-binding protein n=1 Tax=Oceaniradius stylonematis TaxID=2184161 RepID=A0A3A8AII8_9HYPH|nr:sugar ABC transporter ATP-binding protein [Oceaniradius stylonematis]RKF06484.1 sugar ABC transporter ATP-binding protein [Oceaniradius stylonematis]
MAAATHGALVDMRGVTKRYGGVTALDGVDFTVNAGEAVCLAGENGSGKSTLIKILSGVEQPTAGTISINGTKRTNLNPRVSAAAGVMVIFQDFSLFPNMSVAENIAFSTQLGENRRLFDRGHARRLAQSVLERIGVDIALDARVESLPVAHKQLVAICRALASEARLIIMDEPTTALTEREVRSLLAIIRRLKEEGVAVLFVSHKLAEVLEVCEKVFVLRNGKKVAEGPATEFDAASLTRHMTGRDVPEAPPSAVTEGSKTLLEVEHLSKDGAFDDVSFALKAGEVLGVSGLLGSGRTSLAKALFGLVAPDSGAIRLDGEAFALGDPIAAASAGIGYVPEDRLTEGLFLTQSIARNIAVGRLDAHERRGFLDLGALMAEANDWLTRLKVKAPDPQAPVRSLSGGNQQRVALARWLSRAPRVLVLNGPSVGVDVGSKADIHDIIRDLARSGIGVIVISDDLPELLATCHRILVMKAGRVVDEIAGNSVTEDELAHRLAS